MIFTQKLADGEKFESEKSKVFLEELTKAFPKSGWHSTTIEDANKQGNMDNTVFILPKQKKEIIKFFAKYNYKTSDKEYDLAEEEKYVQ